MEDVYSHSEENTRRLLRQRKKHEPGSKGASSEASTRRQGSSYSWDQNSQTAISQHVTAQRNPEFGIPMMVSSPNFVANSIITPNGQKKSTNAVIMKEDSERGSIDTDGVTQAENRWPFIGMNSTPNFLRDQAHLGQSSQNTFFVSYKVEIKLICYSSSGLSNTNIHTGC
ncbi:hypothetical protein DSL72_003662 [Monilinia vaccinii-corymbosi]|uniref:Uncharacterized protein n=1 Tax=Monilinia vaccinii-corymbosi TaxID=61207 RepID=A0A8A3P2X6_9HELO|nr:hypothetical protein DSL72_003662 [Monilinia vaccinii-corymbosi]